MQRGTEGGGAVHQLDAGPRPDTGEIEWYFQHIPAETHDLDEVFEIVLVDRGDGLSLFKMGKIGVLWELDPLTGAFRNAFDLGYQNIVDIDPVSGQGILVRERIPQIDGPVDYCPGPGGLKNLWAMAWHPETEAFYVPLTPGCAHLHFRRDARARAGRRRGRSNDRRFRVHPQSPEQLGRLRGAGQPHGRDLWRPAQAAGSTGQPFSPPGAGWCSSGDIDRYMYAFDARDGEELWRTRTPTATDGFPITYAVDSRQYVAIPSGPGVEHLLAERAYCVSRHHAATAGRRLGAAGLRAASGVTHRATARADGGNPEGTEGEEADPRSAARSVSSNRVTAQAIAPGPFPFVTGPPRAARRPGRRSACRPCRSCPRGRRTRRSAGRSAASAARPSTAPSRWSGPSP